MKKRKGNQMTKPNVKKLFKQTHKVLGLVFCVFIAVVGISGAMFSYFPEFEALEKSYIERDKKGKEVLSFEEILTKFHEQRPNVEIFAISDTIGDPLEVRAIIQDEDHNDPAAFLGDNAAYYFVSRYTGEILPLISRKFFVMIVGLHRAFHPSIEHYVNHGIGNHIVGITTIVITLLSLIGLYLYIPMLKQNFSKNIKLNFKSKGYAFWYKLHSILGVYTSIFVLIMCLTGLYWSYGWFKTGVNKLIGYEEPKYEEIIEQGEPKPNNITEIIKVYSMAKEYAPEHNFHFGIPSRTNESYGILYFGKEYSGEFTYNPQTNESTFKDDDKNITIPLNEKFLYSMLDLHSGEFFGEIGRAIWCVSSLAMGVFGASGVAMFYKRTRNRRKSKGV
jgi:sulfite reductase (NADPH) flavoprotein alpha-component